MCTANIYNIIYIFFNLSTHATDEVKDDDRNRHEDMKLIEMYLLSGIELLAIKC